MTSAAMQLTNANLMVDIRDIKGPVPVPLSGWWWLLAVLVLVVAAAVAWWWWKRRKPAAAAVTVTPPSPLEIARAALAQLHRDNPPTEEFYTRLADIVRQYIEGQFGLHAPERTTEEFLAEATLPPASMELLAAFLQEADLVKFARLRPGAEERARAFAAAERFVEQTQ